MSETGVRQYSRVDLPGANSGVQIQSQDVADQALNWRKMNFRHLYIAPTQQPMAQVKGGTGAVPSGATGGTNVLHFFGQGGIEQFILGAGQTAIVPIIKSDGLEIAGDQAAAEGYEFCAGLTGRSAGVFIVGTDPAFFCRARCVVDDVSGLSEMAVGFRINQAYQAALTSYTDYAVMNLVAGQWRYQTRLNSGAVTNTDLGASYVMADLGNFEVKMNVTAGGVASIEIGTVTAGVATRTSPPLAQAFTFDTSDVITPFIRLINDTDLSDSVRLRQWEAGFAASTK